MVMVVQICRSIQCIKPKIKEAALQNIQMVNHNVYSYESFINASDGLMCNFIK